MTNEQRDRLLKAIQNYEFSAQGHDWNVQVCATQEVLGHPLLHLALVGDPVLTLTVRIPADCDPRIAAARISDAIVAWLAAADWEQHGSITVG